MHRAGPGSRPGHAPGGSAGPVRGGPPTSGAESDAGPGAAVGGCAAVRRRLQRTIAIAAQITRAAAAAPISAHAQPGKPVVSDSSSEAATTLAVATAPTVAAAASEVVDVVVVEVVVEVVVVGGAATVWVWVTVVVDPGAVTVWGGLDVLVVTVWVTVRVVDGGVVDAPESPAVEVSEAAADPVSVIWGAVAVACGVVAVVVSEPAGSGVDCVRLRLVLRVPERLGPLPEPQPATTSAQRHAVAPAIIRRGLSRRSRIICYRLTARP